jgi:acylphosphatase
VKGRVQGVAFRAHVEYFALQIGVTGWVRNVGRNTVEGIAEGTPAQIDQFTEIMKQGPSAARVDETRIEHETATGEFDGFLVKHSL